LFLPLGLIERESVQEKPKTLEELNDAICQEINIISATELRSVLMNMLQLMEIGIDASGDHLQHNP
jgi:hypothetical protein